LITPPPQRVPINRICSDSVKRWFVADLPTLDIVCGGCGKRGERLNTEKSAGCAFSLIYRTRRLTNSDGKSQKIFFAAFKLRQIVGFGSRWNLKVILGVGRTIKPGSNL
jgi:hypothetical protein